MFYLCSSITFDCFLKLLIITSKVSLQFIGIILDWPPDQAIMLSPLEQTLVDLALNINTPTLWSEYS